MKELKMMLEIKNLSKTIADRLILKNVSLLVERGEMVAVVGPNGAGKSTFFKCTVGLLAPSGGQIFLNGQELKKNSIEAKQKIGFLGHESFLYSTLTPLENLLFYGKLYKVKNVKERANELLKVVGLHLFKDLPIRSFSRGMIQRLAIARVLLPDPDVLMLDEPHTGLDQEAIQLLNEIIMEKKESGTAIILISHDFEQVVNLSDKVCILKKGRIADSLKIEPSFDYHSFKQWYEQVVHGK